jgi:hypothetical protein
LNPIYILRFLLIISNGVLHITHELTRHGHIFEAGFLSLAQEYIDKTTLFMRRGLKLSYMITRGMLRFYEEGKNLHYYNDKEELFRYVDEVAARTCSE